MNGPSLKQVTAEVRKLRELEHRIETVQQTLTELNKSKAKMQFETLPEMFADAGLDRLGVPPQGNEPGYEANLIEHVKAVIRSDWPSERREEAFETLQRVGIGDIIKNRIEVWCETDLLDALMVHIKKFKLKGFHPIEVTVERSVPWGTLTSAVKELLSHLDCPLGDKELRQLGASVGRIVKIKDRRSKEETAT